jgi:hypothetical protein
MDLNKMICAHCGQARGKHMASSYHCPVENGFHKTHRFKLYVSRLSNDCHAVAQLKNRSIESIEREVARNLLKQLEQQLGLLDFSREVRQTEVLDGINLIRAGYDL